MHDGEKVFGEGNDLFGSHGCNTPNSATIFPCHRDSRGDLADLLVAGNTVAQQFHRALCEYSDFYSLVILPTNVALMFFAFTGSIYLAFRSGCSRLQLQKSPVSQHRSWYKLCVRRCIWVVMGKHFLQARSPRRFPSTECQQECEASCFFQEA